MATETDTGVEPHDQVETIGASIRYGSSLIGLSGVLFAAFGASLAIRILRGQGVVESGVEIGMTAAELAAVNPALPPYIGHLRMAAAGMFVAFGIAAAALAWYGVRRGQRWAWTTTLVSFVLGTAIGVPMHYSGAFHVDYASHLGPAYAILALFLVGAALSGYGLRRAGRSG